MAKATLINSIQVYCIVGLSLVTVTASNLIVFMLIDIKVQTVNRRMKSITLIELQVLMEGQWQELYDRGG